MAAKAVLPFMSIGHIIPYCLSIINQAKTIKSNNLLHYKLTTCVQLFNSLEDIKKTHHFTPTLEKDTIEGMMMGLGELGRLVRRKLAPVVTELVYKVALHLV